MPLLSIVVPCYNEEPTVPLFFEAVEKIASQVPDLTFEYLFINDGSKDETLKVLRDLQATVPDKVHYISFSRNFGKEAALYAGLQHAAGDFVVVMDVDLQDPPDLLPTMYETLTGSDYDIVGTRRTTRVGEPPIRSFFARSFYKLINRISQTEIVDGARDYRMMTRQVVDSILELAEYNRFSKGIFSWVGYNTKYIPYENKERVAGETSWSFWSLLHYSLDGIVAFSETPLSIASYVGFLSCFVALIALIFIVIRALIFGDPTSGWPSIISIMLLIGGLQLLCLGIVGKYIGKIYLEVKQRPVYIIKEKK